MINKNTKFRVTSPELQWAISENKVTRENDWDMKLEIRNRVADQLKKQKRIDCYDYCCTFPVAGQDLDADTEDFMLTFAYKNKTVLLQGYVVDGEVNTDTVDFLKKYEGKFFMTDGKKIAVKECA